MKTVLYEKDGLIGRVTLNRPEKLNAINDDMPRDLEEAITLANDDPDISVIILSGNGKAFCSGYDLSEYAQGNESNKFTQKSLGILLKTIKLCGMTLNTSCLYGNRLSQLFVKFMVLQLLVGQTLPFVQI